MLIEIGSKNWKIKQKDSLYFLNQSLQHFDLLLREMAKLISESPAKAGKRFTEARLSITQPSIEG